MRLLLQPIRPFLLFVGWLLNCIPRPNLGTSSVPNGFVEPRLRVRGGRHWLPRGRPNPKRVHQRRLQLRPQQRRLVHARGLPRRARGYTIGDTWNGEAWMGFGLNDNGAMNDLWKFDPVTETWTEMASCPCEPRYHPAFVAHEGHIYMGMGSS